MTTDKENQHGTQSLPQVGAFDTAKTLPEGVTAEQLVAADSEDAADEVNPVVYQHRTIRRFSVGRFEFSNFRLTLTSQKDVEEFERLVQTIPQRDSAGIVRLNLAAAAQAMTPVVKSTAVRGAFDANAITTQRDRNLPRQVQTGQAGANLGSFFGKK